MAYLISSAGMPHPIRILSGCAGGGPVSAPAALDDAWPEEPVAVWATAPTRDAITTTSSPINGRLIGSLSFARPGSGRPDGGRTYQCRATSAHSDMSGGCLHGRAMS